MVPKGTKDIDPRREAIKEEIQREGSASQAKHKKGRSKLCEAKVGRRKAIVSQRRHRNKGV